MKTYLLDTNAFIRFLIKDELAQAIKVKELLESIKKNGDRIFLPLFVILEIIFVLESCNKSSREKIVAEIKKLFQINFIEVEKKEVLAKCFVIYQEKHSLSIVDIILLVIARQENFNLFTFDKRLQSTVKNLTI